MRLQLPHPYLKRLLKQTVIRIQKHHILAPGLRQAPVPGPRQAPVYLPYEPHSLVSGRIPFSNLCCIIGGAVVHHYHFEVRVALREDALYGLLQEVSLVVAGDHHAYQPCTSTEPPIGGLVETGHSESPVEVWLKDRATTFWEGLLFA